MKTASFFTYAGPGRVSIARMAPRDHAPGYRIYKALAPHKSMMQLPREACAILIAPVCCGHSTPARCRLHALADPHEPVLLCWERSPFSEANWCHRRMVSEWLGEELGSRCRSCYDRAGRRRLRPPGRCCPDADCRAVSGHTPKRLSNSR